MAVETEWEISDELAGRFWTGVATLFRYAVGMAGTFFEIEKKVVTEYQHALEPTEADTHALGRATSQMLTSAFKKLGVKSLERAEQLIDAMGGFAILLAIGFPLLAFIFQEIPRSPRWLRMKEKARLAKEGKDADGNPIAPGTAPTHRHLPGGGARWSLPAPDDKKTGAAAG